MCVATGRKSDADALRRMVKATDPDHLTRSLLEAPGSASLEPPCAATIKPGPTKGPGELRRHFIAQTDPYQPTGLGVFPTGLGSWWSRYSHSKSECHQ